MARCDTPASLAPLPEGVPADPSEVLLTTEEAARVLGLATNTLRNWRQRGEGPTAVRPGGTAVRYPRSTLDSYIAGLKAVAA